MGTECRPASAVTFGRREWVNDPWRGWRAWGCLPTGGFIPGIPARPQDRAGAGQRAWTAWSEVCSHCTPPRGVSVWPWAWARGSTSAY